MSNRDMFLEFSDATRALPRAIESYMLHDIEIHQHGEIWTSTVNSLSTHGLFRIAGHIDSSLDADGHRKLSQISPAIQPDP